MNPLYQYLSYSILIGGILALVRFRKINKDYHPFLIMLWAGGCNEIISSILINNGYYNTVSNNTYSIVSSLLLIWLFVRLGSLRYHKQWAFGLGVCFIFAWIAENFIFGSFTQSFCSYFNIIHASVLVFLSINSINRLLVTERDLLRHPFFLICIGILIFFTYMIIVEVFWVYGNIYKVDIHGELFSGKVYRIMSWINMLCNLVYAFAILWVHKKKAFTLPF